MVKQATGAVSQYSKAELAHRFKDEPLRKGWESYEQDLLRLSRKLTEEQRIELTCYAERMALARIRERLAKKRQSAKRAGVSRG